MIPLSNSDDAAALTSADFQRLLAMIHRRKFGPEVNEASRKLCSLTTLRFSRHDPRTRLSLSASEGCADDLAHLQQSRDPGRAVPGIPEQELAV